MHQQNLLAALSCPSPGSQLNPGSSTPAAVAPGLIHRVGKSQRQEMMGGGGAPGAGTGVPLCPCLGLPVGDLGMVPLSCPV